MRTSLPQAETGGAVASERAEPSASASGPPSSDKRRKRDVGNVLGEVEGQGLRFEEHGEEGHNGAYKRYIVSCPLHTVGDDLCWKARNLGNDQTQRFGQDSPR